MSFSCFVNSSTVSGLPFFIFARTLILYFHSNFVRLQRNDLGSRPELCRLPILLNFPNMDEDTEDVIFEGSPLFEYLKEACPEEEFETSPLPKTEDSDGHPTESKQSFMEKVTNFIRKLNSRRKQLNQWPFFQLRESERRQKTACQLRTLSQVTKSRLVGVDDLTFLCSLENYLKEIHQSTGHLVPIIYVFTSGILFLAASVCLLLPQTFNLSTHGLPVSYRDWLELSIGSLFVSGAVVTFIRGICHHRLVRLFHRQKNQSVEYINQEELFQKAFRRSLQYVQEVEVLSRGYTMVNLSSYSGSNPSDLQLLPLRKACISAITKHLVTLRNATKQLSTEFTILPEFMLSDECITNQKLPDWIEDASQDSQDGGAVAGGTPNKEVYSLSTLKILFGLYKEQCSDFVRQLILSWLDRVQLRKHQETDLNKLKEWLRILAHCVIECKETTVRLNQTYKLHKWSPASDKVTPNGTFSRREVWRPEVQLVTALHSLRLHSETVLSRICPFDDIMTETEEISIAEDTLDALQKLMSEISDHVEASQMCYQETKACLDKLMNKGNTQNATEEDGGHVLEEGSTEEPNRVQIIDDDSDDMSSDFEEQIFEAYIDVKRKLQQDEDSEEWHQEKTQRRREAEDAKRMLQELNSVLSKRSEEKKRLKQDKLQKKMSVVKQKPQDVSLSQDLLNSQGDTHAQTSELSKQSEVLQPNPSGSGDQEAVATSSKYDEASEAMLEYSNSNSVEYARHVQSGVNQHISEEQSHQTLNDFKRDNIHEKSENVYSSGHSLQDTSEDTLSKNEDNPCSYECEHFDDFNSDHRKDSNNSQDRAPLLAVNPWMVPGLAAQVAKISQQKIQLSEDTFGEDSTDEEDNTKMIVGEEQ